MTPASTQRRPGRLSIALIAASITASAAVSLAMDAVLIRLSTDVSAVILADAILFNGTGIMQSVVGGIIEWRRPGHAIGRLMMLAGPFYAIVAAAWTTFGTIEPLVDPEVYRVFSWTGTLFSWPAVALIAGWIPVLFPTGTLPGPRWRAPAALLLSLTIIGLIAMSVRPGPIVAGFDLINPFGIESWPGFLQPFVDAIPLAVLATVLLAVAAVITRYRRGDRIERLQIRWFAAAVAIVPVSLLGMAIEVLLRSVGGGGPDAPNALVSAVVSYAGILAMPIAIGIALTRYHLYEIDRLISRGLSWAVLSGLLLAVYAGAVLLLQTVLGDVIQGQTVAVAGSTLLAAALFQPLRRRVQAAVDHRFNRARYDAERTATDFAERLRDEVDLASVSGDIVGVVDTALHPSSIGVWIRRSGPTTP